MKEFPKYHSITKQMISNKVGYIYNTDTHKQEKDRTGIPVRREIELRYYKDSHLIGWQLKTSEVSNDRTVLALLHLIAAWQSFWNYSQHQAQPMNMDALLIQNLQSLQSTHRRLIGHRCQPLKSGSTDT